MPMEPMDAMWWVDSFKQRKYRFRGIKPPTVADAFGSSNVVFKSAIKNNNQPIERKMTIAAGETIVKQQDPPSPVAIPRTRHFSISETFGSPLLQAFSWASPRQRSVSVCESDPNAIKEMLQKQNSNN